jgi:hypothetical protein
MKSFFLAVFTALFFFTASASAQDALKQAKILDLSGSVEIRASSSATWVQAQKGILVGEKTEFRTGPESMCRLALGDEKKSVVKIGAETKAVVSSLDPVMIDIESGEALSMVRNLRKGSTFQVRTPTAVAVARGTGWDQTLKKIKVFESEIHVQGAGGQENDVPEGKGIGIGDDGSLGEIFDLSKEDLAEWKEFQGNAGSSDTNNDTPSDLGDDQNQIPGGFDSIDDLQDSKDKSNEAKDEAAINEMLKSEDKKNRGGY